MCDIVTAEIAGDYVGFLEAVLKAVGRTSIKRFDPGAKGGDQEKPQ